MRSLPLEAHNFVARIADIESDGMVKLPASEYSVAKTQFPTQIPYLTRIVSRYRTAKQSGNRGE